MSQSVNDWMSCPVCLETMTVPILQCKEGHSVCGVCIKSNNIKHCPLCRAVMTSTRSYKLEELIENLKGVTLKIACKYASRGCKYELNLEEKDSHELECKSRVYKCEGKSFCKWDCQWEGSYVEILQHFKAAHFLHCWMEFKTEFNMKIDMKKSFKDIQVIDFCNGQQLFWYKHKTDVKKGKAFWLFQYVGSKKQAAQYFYEFEVYYGATRKLKISEICESDCEDTDMIFDSEKCVALSYTTIKNYLNERGELSIRFRIMKIKKDSTGSSNVPQGTNPIYKNARTVISTNLIPPPPFICKPTAPIKKKSNKK